MTTKKTDAERLAGDTKPEPAKATKKTTKKTTTGKSTKRLGDAAPSKPTPKRGPGRPPKPKVDTIVADSVRQVGASLYVFGTASGSERLAYDGNVLVYNADALGAAMADLTESNPKMAQAIEKMFTTGKTARSFITIAGVVVPIAANHGVIPAGIVPMVNPELVKAHGMPPAPPRPPAPAPSQPAPAKATGDPTTFGPVDDPEGPSPQQVEARERLAAFVQANSDRADQQAAELLDSDGNPSGAAGLPQ